MSKFSINQIKNLMDADNKIMLIICGPSGSGKTTFEKILYSEHTDLFSKMKQATTRERRDGETVDDYYFVTKDEIRMLWNSLIARISFNENYYGTFPMFDDKRINTVIASYEGIKDIFEACPRCVAYGDQIRCHLNTYSYQWYNLLKEFKIKVFILFMDIDNNDLNTKRKNRSIDFINEERSLLQDLLNKEFLAEHKNELIQVVNWNYSTQKKWPMFEDIFE